MERASWKPDGSVVALPGARRVGLLQRGTWKFSLSPETRELPHAQDIRFVSCACVLVAEQERAVS